MPSWASPMSDRLLEADMVLAEADYLLSEDVIDQYLRCEGAYSNEERLIAEDQANDVRLPTIT